MRELHEQINAILEQPQERPTIHSPRDAYDYLLPFLANLPREEFWAVALDTRNRIRQIVKLYSGTVNQSNLGVAEVFRQAIIEKINELLKLKMDDVEIWLIGLWVLWGIPNPTRKRSKP